jgi:hypothetical protein
MQSRDSVYIGHALHVDVTFRSCVIVLRDSVAPTVNSMQPNVRSIRCYVLRLIRIQFLLSDEKQHCCTYKAHLFCV